MKKQEGEGIWITRKLGLGPVFERQKLAASVVVVANFA